MLDRLRKMLQEQSFEAAWEFCKGRKNACGKAKWFGALQEVCHKKQKNTHGKERDKWEQRKIDCRHMRRQFERRCEAQQEREDRDWPKDMVVAELLYHAPGPHCHFASPERGKLIEVGHIVHDKFKCRVGEFPPFDYTEPVHTSGSWHYRDPARPYVGVAYSASHMKLGGDWGLAMDLNDLDGGNDDDYAAYLAIRSRYG